MSVFKVLAVIVVWSQVETQSQSGSLQKVKLGDTLHVSCEVYRGSRTLVWYKLDSSRRLQLVGSANTHNGQTFYTDHRYLLESSENEGKLSVSNVTWADEGMYFCGVMNQNDVRFLPGTVVEIEGQSTIASKKNCSYFQIISRTSGDDEYNTCQNRVNHGEASCFHNLLLKDVSSGEDATYLRVVTACEDTLLGNGTRNHQFSNSTGQCLESVEVFGPSPTVMALSGLSVVLAVTVAVLLQEMDRVGRRSRQNTQAEDGVIYTGVDVEPGSIASSVETYIGEAALFSIVKYSQAKIRQD